MRVKNLTNSPYELVDESGEKLLLPARGEIKNFKPHPMHASTYATIGYFKITEENEQIELVDDSTEFDAPVDEQVDEKPKRRGRPTKRAQE